MGRPRVAPQAGLLQGHVPDRPAARTFRMPAAFEIPGGRALPGHRDRSRGVKLLSEDHVGLVTGLPHGVKNSLLVIVTKGLQSYF